MPNQYTNKKTDDTDISYTAPVEWTKVDSGKTELKIDEDKPKHNKESEKKKEPKTIIRHNYTRKEYEKVDIPYPGKEQYDRLERFERLTRGNWTRKVTSISWIRTIDDKEYLDWNETRHGRTDAKRPLNEPVSHAGLYEIPVPHQETAYDEENEEYKTVTKDRPSATETGYLIPFSKEALDELLEDSVPRSTEYILLQQNGRAYSISKKEIQSSKTFDELYNLKSGNKDKED